MAPISSLQSLNRISTLLGTVNSNYGQSAIILRYFTKVSSSGGPGKVVKNVEEALEGVKDNDTLLVGGFGNCGVPEHLLRGMQKRGVKDLTIIAGTAGTDDFGLGLLVKDKLVKRIVTSYMGEHDNLFKQFSDGSLEVELTPQGSIAERVRAGGAGIPAFYTPCGVGTLVHEGGVPIRYESGEITGKGIRAVAEAGRGRQEAEFNGKTYILETAITGDYALARAWKADTAGNLIFRKTARNFNPGMLMAARVGIVEVEEIVPLGDLDPNHIHLPGIYVDRILLGDKFEKRIEKRTVQKTSAIKGNKTPAQEIRNRIARRVALEFRDGMYVNLGIGIPCHSINYIPAGTRVTMQGENGVMGLGPHPTEDQIDPDMTNPSKELATYVSGAAFMSSEDTFAMVRGGHLDLTVLGAMQVSQFGDIANWMVPGKLVKGMGGAMDLVSAPGTKVIVAMEHTARDGSHKILAGCDLPLTGKNSVNVIITEKCVFEVDPESGLTLTEMAEGVEVADVMASTGCEFAVAENLKPMGQAPSDD